MWVDGWVGVIYVWCYVRVLLCTCVVVEGGAGGCIFSLCAGLNALASFHVCRREGAWVCVGVGVCGCVNVCICMCIIVRM